MWILECTGADARADGPCYLSGVYHVTHTYTTMVIRKSCDWARACAAHLLHPNPFYDLVDIHESQITLRVRSENGPGSTLVPGARPRPRF